MAEEGEVKDKKFENLDKWHEANAKETFTIKTKAFIKKSGEKLYLTPALHLGLHENPFKESTRTYPLDLGVPSEYIFNFSYDIPAGYKIEEMPKPLRAVFADNAISFDYVVDATTPNQLKINVKRKFKRTKFGVEEYNDLKAFYTSMISKLKEQVVIAKI